MTNPFATSTAAVTDTTPAAPPSQVTTAKPAAAPASLGIGDPFAAPVGIGDGERITDFVDRLLLVKPTEYIEKMDTTQGKTDAVRVDLAVLDDSEEPGKIVRGVLLFQQALKREAKAILEGPLPYLLGRLDKGKTNSNNTIYTFLVATEEEADVARKWLKLGGVL